MSEELILETNALTKVYNGLKAVDEVNMHIRKGDIYGFVGENGAGKTTIIRLIAGLAKPNSGSFSLFGIPNTDPRIGNAKSKMGGIVETVSLNKSMSAMDNLKLQCLITGVKKTDEELVALLEKVGLADVAKTKKKAGHFSLGMRQRLGIASTLLSDPEFIILDEPMNGLDPQGFIEMRELILRLHDEGATFLISSHILSELDKICNTVGFISHGKLLEEMTMEELRNKSRKKTIVSSKNSEGLLKVLKENMKFTSIEKDGENYVIYDEIDINKLIRTFVLEHIEIERINVVEETIEDYYAQTVIRGLKQ